tara:strand:- start:170 stop:526 length:357 start_codon:yes stop_codon:yes gene_type:complete
MEIVKAINKVRLYVGLQGGTEKVLRLTDSKQWAEANWFNPSDAKGILDHVMKITGKGGSHEGMKFDSVYTEELEKNKGEVYVGYFKGKIGRGIQIRRASTGTNEELGSAGKAGEVDII